MLIPIKCIWQFLVTWWITQTKCIQVHLLCVMCVSELFTLRRKLTTSARLHHSQKIIFLLLFHTFSIYNDVFHPFRVRKSNRFPWRIKWNGTRRRNYENPKENCEYKYSLHWTLKLHCAVHSKRSFVDSPSYSHSTKNPESGLHVAIIFAIC